MLKKFRLKNVSPDMKKIVFGDNIYYLESLTDEQAELIYNNGKSNYIEPVTSEDKPQSKKDKL